MSLCRAALVLSLLLLGGCWFRPEVVSAYPEPGCSFRAKRMVLKVEPLALSGGRIGVPSCYSNTDCVMALLVTGGVITAGSAIVSGSIVVVGNVVYWFEQQGRCLIGDPSAV